MIEEDITITINQYITSNLPHCKQYLQILTQMTSKENKKKELCKNFGGNLIKEKRVIPYLCRISHLMVNHCYYLS